MKKTQKLLFIGEGQTEDALVGNLFQGKVKIFNLAQNSISKIIRTIPKPNEVSIFLMIDTDILLDAKKLACLIENIEYLKRMKYSISILQQKDDLEEELAKACSCNIRELLRYTQCSSKNELKSKFIKNPSCVLSHPNFDINKLWTTPLIESLSNYQALQINASNLPRK